MDMSEAALGRFAIVIQDLDGPTYPLTHGGSSLAHSILFRGVHLLIGKLPFWISVKG
jgi:hypothetical protein